MHVYRKMVRKASFNSEKSKVNVKICVAIKRKNDYQHR